MLDRSPTNSPLRRRNQYTNRLLAGRPVLTETWQNAEAQEGSPMEIVPLGPGFAAELRGVMLAEIAAADASYKKTRAALEEHSVLVFRGQS